jgi:hypothetical protein
MSACLLDLFYDVAKEYIEEDVEAKANVCVVENQSFAYNPLTERNIKMNK